MDLSVIIPTYNEEDIIEKSIKSIYRTLKELDRDFELIIADDGSTDNTRRVVEEKFNNVRDIRLITNQVNRGKGAVLSDAFHHAGGDLQIYIDVDLILEINQLKTIINLLEGDAAIVIGSKHMTDSSINYPKFRTILSRFYSMLARFLLGSNIRDFQCGLKGFRKGTLTELLPNIKNRGWSWDTEILLKATWRGYKIVEIPLKVTNIYPRESKFHLISDSLLMGWELVQLWFEKNRR